MLFFIHCADKPNHGAVRAENRQAHLDYLADFTDAIMAAGPTLSEDGTGMTGSVFLIEFPDRAAADAFTGGDPYNKAGLFESIAVHGWKKVLPKD